MFVFDDVFESFKSHLKFQEVLEMVDFIGNCADEIDFFEKSRIKSIQDKHNSVFICSKKVVYPEFVINKLISDKKHIVSPLIYNGFNFGVKQSELISNVSEAQFVDVDMTKFINHKTNECSLSRIDGVLIHNGALKKITFNRSTFQEYAVLTPSEILFNECYRTGLKWHVNTSLIANKYE